VAVAAYAVSALVALLSPALATLIFAAVSLAYVAPTFLNARKDD
jgi:hypothetical protein